MELFQLKYYVSIAETLSFTKAADLLHVSQPALSYQMRRLEGELGVDLFLRERRKIALTPEGEILLPLAQAVLFRADEAVRVLKEHLGFEAGEVRMGCSPSVATYAVPPMLASFRRSFPRVRVQLVEGGDLELQRGVLEGAIDFAVVTAPGSPQALEVTPLAAEDLLVVVPPGHRYASRSTIALGELAQEQFVFPSGSFNIPPLIIDACRRVGFEPRVVYHAASLESVKGFVRQALGISVLPRMAVEGPGKEGLVTMGIEGGLTRELNLIQGKDRSLTGAAQALMTHVRVYLSEKVGRPLAARTTRESTPVGV
jgi:DNA-binding transcriptional LysR family regulator